MVKLLMYQSDMSTRNTGPSRVCQKQFVPVIEIFFLGYDFIFECVIMNFLLDHTENSLPLLNNTIFLNYVIKISLKNPKQIHLHVQRKNADDKDDRVKI